MLFKSTYRIRSNRLLKVARYRYEIVDMALIVT